MAPVKDSNPAEATEIKPPDGPDMTPPPRLRHRLALQRVLALHVRHVGGIEGLDGPIFGRLREVLHVPPRWALGDAKVAKRMTGVAKVPLGGTSSEPHFATRVTLGIE